MRAAGMDRDLHVGHILHRLPMRIGQPVREISVGLARIDPVHVIGEGIERIATLGRGKGQWVDARHKHHRAAQLGRVDAPHRQRAGQRALGLIAMDRGIDPEGRARTRPIDDDDRDLDLDAASQVQRGDRAAHHFAGLRRGGADGDAFIRLGAHTASAPDFS